MYTLSSLRRALLPFSASSLLRSCAASPGCLQNVKGSSYSPDNVARGGSGKHMSEYSGNLGRKFGLLDGKENVSASRNLGSFREKERISAPLQIFSHSAVQKDWSTERNSKPMDFVREVIDGSQFSQNNADQNADIVHIKLMRNNTFVTVTDCKGNIKTWGTSRTGELRDGPKQSRYAAEATAESVGRQARVLGSKSVVIKVKGFTYFKKKRQAIMSFKEGFTNSRSGYNPIVAIEDTTRRPHNGCRLPKRRRI